MVLLSCENKIIQKPTLVEKTYSTAEYHRG